MPYTPPAGNAVTFNFTGTYSAPAGNAVIFNFGGGSPLPPQAQTPTGLRLARLYEDDWAFSRSTRFAPVVAQPFMLRHVGLSRWMIDEEPRWIAPRPLEIHFQPPSMRHRRRMLFTVT